MKKIIIIVACTLLFCGGLFCLHIVAQRGDFTFPEDLISYPKNLGTLVFDVTPGDASQTTATSLLDRKLEECSERELLELKVAACRRFADAVADAGRAGSPRGSVSRLAESHAALAAALIELYRHTGEQEKLQLALQSRVEALTDKLRAVSDAYEAGALNRITLDDVYKAETQLLDALLEQKREKKNRTDKTTPPISDRCPTPIPKPSLGTVIAQVRSA